MRGKDTKPKVDATTKPHERSPAGLRVQFLDRSHVFVLLHGGVKQPVLHLLDRLLPRLRRGRRSGTMKSGRWRTPNRGDARTWKPGEGGQERYGTGIGTYGVAVGLDGSNDAGH